MTINTVSMNRIPTNPSNASTLESSKLQTQLTTKEQSLNKLSSDNSMTAQDKEKERREIQREIAEINRKLKLKRMEEKQEAKEAAKEQDKKRIIKEELLEEADSDSNDKKKADELEKTSKNNSANTEKEDALTKDIPLVTLKNVLTADSQVTQNVVQNNAGKQLEHQKEIIKAEMQSDTLLGTDTTAKKEALTNLRKKEDLQIEVLNNRSETVTPDLQFGSKIIIRE
ncbi:MAG: hypothetical protein IJ274_04485 [Lachnospiraceae bacterium]|nr:hypothetical protein [Lachnospiraceae bacterium]